MDKMDTPRHVRLVGADGCFKARTGSFDISNSPSQCRGTTQMGYRCSRTIAAKHIPNFPQFTLKGSAAYYRDKTYGNCIVAYYCWQHTGRLPFVPVDTSGTVRVKAGVEVEAAVRRPLGEKTTNGVVRAEKPVAKVKVEVLESEEASSECRRADRPARPQRIDTAVAQRRRADSIVLSPTLASPKALSPREKVETPKSPVIRKKNVEIAELKETVKKQDGEIAELKVVNGHWLAAVQELTSRVESLQAKMQSIEEEQAASLAKTLETEKEAKEAKEAKKADGPVDGNQGSGVKPASGGYYEPPEPMDAGVTKQPVVDVQPIDLESGLPVNRRLGAWDRIKAICCLCLGRRNNLGEA